MKVNYPVFGSCKALVPMLILTAGSISINNPKNEFVEISDEFVHNPPQIEAVETFDYRKFIFPYGIKTDEEKTFERKQKLISDIIKQDKSSPQNYTDTDRKRIAKLILKASEFSGIDFDIITFIAKRETHFNQNLSGKNGKGMMQITSIVPKDMYQRPDFYDKNLKPLINKYGSLYKLFEAKEKDDFLDLGNFGEFLYKHKNYENLLKACINDAQTNLFTGAYCYKAKRMHTKSMLDALAAYNSTDIKYDYARDILDNIIKFRQQHNLDVKKC